MFPIARYGRNVAERVQNSIVPKRLGQSFLLGLGAALCFSTGARAAETITIRYLDDTLTVPVTNLETFAETGQAQTPEVQQFFQKYPNLGRIVRDALTAQVYISESFLQDTLHSSVGDFVLLKLNELIGSPSWRQDLQPLRSAVLEAYESNNSFSILEVIQNLPDENITLNLSGLEPVYQDVKAFIEKVYPALVIAKQFLQDLVCDCQAAPAASEPGSTTPSTSSPANSSPSNPSGSGSPRSALPGADQTVLAARNCNNAASVHTSQASPAPHSISTTASTTATVVTPVSEPARP